MEKAGKARRQERRVSRKRELASHTAPTLGKQSVNRKWGWHLNPQSLCHFPSLLPCDLLPPKRSHLLKVLNPSQANPASREPTVQTGAWGGQVWGRGVSHEIARVIVLTQSA